MNNLFIDGRPESNRKDCRFRVVADGREYWLTARSFEYLVRLAMATSRRLAVHISQFGEGRVSQYIYRLKSELPEIRIKNLYRGYYNLEMKPENIKFNHPQLAKYPHYNIRKMFNNIKIKK